RLTDRPSQDALAAIGMVWRVAAIATACATMLYLILSLLGLRLRSESHLGFAGTAVAALWFLGMGWGTPQPDYTELGVVAMREAPWIGAVLPQSLSIGYGYQIEHGSYSDLVFASRLAGPLLVNFVIQLGLAALFVRRYGRRI